MRGFDLVRRRLSRQLGRRSFANPTDVVRSFGAVQAQDYLGALWAIGLRVPSLREADVERAFADRSIVRTWPMRGTLHFVAADDVRWMLELMAPHVVARASRRFAELGIGEADLARSRRVLARSLRNGAARTRSAVYAALGAANISTTGQRGIHILWRLAQEGLICFGPRQGKEHTFALLEAWLPAVRRLPHDEALAEVSLRYFTGHGPATLSDFTWWSGLPAAKARAGLESAKPRLERETVGDRTYWFASRARPGPVRVAGAYLLPAFDEYLVGYRDRSAVLHDARVLHDGGGMLAPTAIVNGQVIGTWKRALRAGAVAITVTPAAPMTPGARSAVARAARAYGAFLGRAASVVTVPGRR
jgi:hypothetical protein